MCWARWAGTPSACPRKIRRSSTKSIPKPGRWKTSSALRNNWPVGVSVTIGTGRSLPACRIITGGRSGYSCSFIKKDWPIARKPLSIGAKAARPYWPTSRSLTAVVSAARLKWFSANCASGFSRLPLTRRRSSMISSFWKIGRSASKRCRLIGLDALKAQKLSLAWMVRI